MAKPVKYPARKGTLWTYEQLEAIERYAMEHTSDFCKIVRHFVLKGIDYKPTKK